MRLLYRLNGHWIQLMTDSALDKNNYLAEFYDKNDDTIAAIVRANLRIPDNYWSKKELAGPVVNDPNSTYHAVSPNVIHENENKRFVTDDQIGLWTNKVDRPYVGANPPASSKVNGIERNITDGRVWYDYSTDTLALMLRESGDANAAIKYRAPDNYRFTSGTGTFNGLTGATITHNCVDSYNRPKVPDHISVTPNVPTNGYLGEYYVTDINNKTFKVYNTGSGRPTFSWCANFRTGSNPNIK